MSSASRYFLKEGYIQNFNTSSLDSDELAPHQFWTPDRLEIAAYYQYHVYKYAAGLANKYALRTIADVGCGPAVKTSMFFGSSHHSVTLYDQESCREICNKNMPEASFLPVNLEKPDMLGTKTACDLVLCSDVLEHLANPLHCIDLCKRLVDPKGYIIFSTPERNNLRGKSCFKSGHPQHIREWCKEEFLQLLRFSRLEVIESRLLPQHSLNTGEEIRYRLTLGIHRPSKYLSCHLVVCRL